MKNYLGTKRDYADNRLQCDRIGLFSNDFGDKISFKSGPNIWQYFGEW